MLALMPARGEGRKRSRGNVINQVRETGLKPIECIQATHPIVILDEPQNLETDNRRLAIARLNPMCTLRYSATHRRVYNLIYSLDPVRAYELGLVKQIGVDSVIELKDANQAFVEVEGLKCGKRSVSAKLSVWVNQASGPAKKSLTVKNGDDLYALSNQREIYRDGFIVNEIDAGEGFITFANDVRVRQGQPHGALTDAILRLQIEATVRSHFEKAQKLHPQGIKVLSVSFIDRVVNYRVYGEDGTASKGKFGEWFEEIYEQYRAREEFSNSLPFDADKVHNGYFSLPRWFQIETPVGAYNPDWAVAYRNDKTLYFVAKTKKTGNGDPVRLDLLRPIEDLRIECGKRHFKNFEEVCFRVVSTLTELVA